MLHRGFTSVRDAAGADFGLQEAVQRGIFEGPRLSIAGFPVSQTGGHADMRPKGVRNREMFCTCAGLGLVGAIADGVGEVRRAVREQVRNGANQIKIMAGGGISLLGSAAGGVLPAGPGSRAFATPETRETAATKAIAKDRTSPLQRAGGGFTKPRRSGASVAEFGGEVDGIASRQPS